MFRCCLQIAALLCAAALPSSAKNPFYFGHVYTSNTTDAIAAIQLATDTINNSSSPLSGYLANLSSTLTQCQLNVALQLSAINTFATASPAKYAVVGGWCPALAATSDRSLNLLQISYDTGAVLLYSTNFIRTYPSDVHLVSLITAVLRYYGWKQVHLITQNEAQFTSVTQLLRQGIATSTESIVSSSDTQISGIFPTETRIFVLNMYPLIARRIICYAVQQDEAGLDPSHYYAEYVWITLGWYPQQWWTKGVTPDSQYTDNFTTCSDAALEDMLHWALAVNHRPQPLNSTGNTNVNYTSAQFETLMTAAGPSTNASDYFFQTSIAPFAYDAIFALAFALNSVNKMNISSNASNFTAYLGKEMLKLNFTGVSGPVTFDSNGTRIQASLQVMQYRRHNGSITCGNASSTGYFERVAIGTVNNGAFQYISCENNQTVWGSLVPPDGSQRTTYTVIKLPLFIIYSILASTGIVFAIVCALFNIINHNHKIVRLTSPNLNYLILFGVSLMLFSVYLYCVSSSNFTTQTITGRIRLWTQAIGFSLCFGTILAKVGRIFYIFHNPSATKKKPPKDWQLFLFVMVLVAIDIIYLTVALILDNYTAKPFINLEKPKSRDANNVITTYYYVEIRGDHEKIWKTIIYVFKAMVQALACFFAIATRNIHIRVLNDAKYISTIIYTTTVLLLVSVIGLFTLSGKYLNSFAGVFSGSLLVVCYVVLSFLFIPKMWIFYKDPKGENIFERSNSVSAPSSSGGDQPDGIKLKRVEKKAKESEVTKTINANVEATNAQDPTLSTPPASPRQDSSVFEDSTKKLDIELSSSTPIKKVSFAGQDEA